MIRRIGRHFREAFHGLIRHGAMTLSSAAAISLALLFVGIFILISQNIRDITYSIEESVQIHVKIDRNYETQDQINILQIQITEIPGIKEVIFSSKDQELDSLIESFGEDGQIFESYRGESNPLRHAFLVDVIDGNLIERVALAIERIAGVETVRYGGAKTVELMNMLDSVRNWGYILVIGLIVIAVFLISNTIKLSIASRRDEIAIMRTVGAKNGFIRMPFLIEGMVIGILGSIMPIGITVGGYFYLYELLGGFLISQMFVLHPPLPLLYYIGTALVILAMIVGMMGSFVSVTKHLRWKR